MFLNKNKNIETPKDLFKKIERLEKEVEEINKSLKEVKEKNKKSLQKIGITRFNPFGEIGGDQSFSIAILDENNDGFVITSHYGRESNRVYAKPIKAGKSEYVLSKEEGQAIVKSLNS
jgi:DNA gyrase/topoisomerase IV subunit A